MFSINFRVFQQKQDAIAETERKWKCKFIGPDRYAEGMAIGFGCGVFVLCVCVSKFFGIIIASYGHGGLENEVREQRLHSPFN